MTEKFLHSEPITRLQEWAVDPHTQQPVSTHRTCMLFLFCFLAGMFPQFSPLFLFFSLPLPLSRSPPLPPPTHTLSLTHTPHTNTHTPPSHTLPLTRTLLQWSHVLAEPLLQLGPRGPVLTVERHFAVRTCALH